jgi:hypothetical protein
MNKFLKELEDRAHNVNQWDVEIQNRNKESFKSLWMNMIIFSSAFLVGFLPLLESNSNIIKNILLAKIGLFIIILIIITNLLYYEKVLRREQALLFEVVQSHDKTFSLQFRIIKSAIEKNKREDEIEEIFEKSKGNGSNEEREIRIKHLVGGKFFKLRIFIDKYFSRFMCYGFILGLIFIILSCINIISK